MSKLLIAGLLILIAFGGYAMTTYNGLVSQDESANAAWSEIQNQYKRRFDLVPQLVETVKGAANFEKDTITAVTEARAGVAKTQLPEGGVPSQEQMDAYLKAQKELGSSLGRLLVTVEAYPELKATGNFRALQDQLEGTENRIAVARRDYIDAIQVFNSRVRKFPGNVVAGMVGLERRPQLEFDEEAVQQVPKVDFSK
ncbi:MAG TPA: LemA family protein [Planctomycetota bacterium]|nr:LemA family protein [Planctomycetota bacterium]HPF13773.1 LemA family protein [Planctomycetota bacterium]HRV81245.1 LemA family protein [Planctomycetota bacterium]